MYLILLSGLNKMVINHLSKLFVTNDAATIIKELDVFHPAAKLVVLASQMQEQEVSTGIWLKCSFCSDGRRNKFCYYLCRRIATPCRRVS